MTSRCCWRSCCNIPCLRPFIIPLFADLGDDAEYVSTTLSLGTVLAVVLFFFLWGVQPGITEFRFKQRCPQPGGAVFVAWEIA